ncbi:MAG: hypothetical protein ACPL3C_09415 [Pyrobaculum sp.]
MEKVLWVSRHYPLPCQVEQLRQKLGDVEIEQFVGFVPNAESVVELAKRVGAKYVLPVLPLSFVARLVELAKQHGLVILWGKMRLVATTTDVEEAWRIVKQNPRCRTMVHYADAVRVYEAEGIERVVEVRVVTEPL